MARLKGEKANVTRAGRARENRYESVEQERKEQVETAERTRPYRTFWTDFILIAMGNHSQGKI